MSLNRTGIRYALPTGMELLGRLGVVVGISLILTLLLLVLYQDGGSQADTRPVGDTQASASPVSGTP